MSDAKLQGEKRTEFGKGAARRLRRANMIPAVLYGHGTDPVHIALPYHDTMMALKVSNALLHIEIGSKTQLALPKDVQRDPVKNVIEHVDLLIVRRGEKVTVEVPVRTVGDPVSGNLASIELNTLSLEVEATHIPTEIEVSVEGLDTGAQVLAQDIELPHGASLVTEPETLVVNVTIPKVDTEPDLGAEGGAAAEPEKEESAAAAEKADKGEKDAS